tara:strand:+ start:71 stop:889 length:819 start_codon:yes stop_codon:yes gene_type:complete
MKSLLSILSLPAGLLILPISSIAQEDTGNSGSGSDEVVPQWQKDFEVLGSAKQKAYREHLREAGRLFNQKRIIEALNELGDAQSVFPNEPSALNLVGACHVEFRSFAKARDAFEQALKLQSDHLEGVEILSGEARARRIKPVLNILFNLVEMDFVTKQWADCAARIESLLPDMEPSELTMIRLLEFKYLLCKLKLGAIEEARTLAKKYDYLDDYPYYYYAQAALAYHDDDETEAERWRGTAKRVFRRPSTLAAWEDTMIEIGFVKSFYGGAP